jgi:ADP-heptose:LPS heptosyltransferase
MAIREQSLTSMRPLIVRFAAFGDVVLLTTLIELLSRRYGGPVDILGSGNWTSKLLANDPRVGHVQLVTSRKSPYWMCPSQWRAIDWLRGRAPGPVFLCEPDGKSQWLLDHAGIPRTAVLRSFDYQAPDQIQFSRWWEQIGQLSPQQFAVPPLNLATLDSAPRLYCSAEDRASCDTWLRHRGLGEVPLIMIQPGNKRTLKRGRIAALTDNKYWPVERWVELVRELLRLAPTAQVLLCGVPAEAGVLDAIYRQLNSARVHDLSAELTVQRLLPLLERADGMISVDTGPAHAAAALDCPLIVMFGNKDQRVWCPRSRLGRVIPIGGAAGAGSSLRDISVAQALAAWSQLPKRGGADEDVAPHAECLPVQRAGGASNI